MPHVNEMFPSKFLKAADIDQDYEVTIAEISKDTLGQGAEAEEKYILFFEEYDKGLVLNKTNTGLIAAQHGDDTDKWKGKKVVLTVEDVTFQGKITPAIRIRRPARPSVPQRRAGGPQPRPASAQAAADQAADEQAPF